ncbi:D-alanyl-D-alanine carboxypeptidase family protein [Oscillospiraceae bacterium 50-16]
MKGLCCGVLAAALLLQIPAAEAVSTSASSVVLMDGDSGRVLYQSNPHERRLIASITKLMTALTALESGHGLEETVTIDPAWTGVEGSSLYLRAGEEVRLETLLYGMLLRSGNDAATAVAGFCAESVEDFVAEMNRNAARLGMENSRFANPSGLNDEGHWSTAYDMALLARACLTDETLAQMVSTRSITLEGRSFVNHNKLLWQYEGCIGLKTGYTQRAGRTLVSAAERDGMTLICVTLNDPCDWKDHAALFDWGFKHYTPAPQIQAGEEVGQLPVAGGLLPVCPIQAAEGFSIALAPGEQAEGTWELSVTALEAPVREGTPVGELVYTLGQEELAKIPLVTARAVPDQTAPEGGFLSLWRNVFKN